jgi:aryl-alcohol dehydrogenase-like predicted oxidoreductase
VVKAGKARYIGASSMFAWQFAKAQHVAGRNGWTRFASMQNHYNLLYREEEREMIPLCLDEGVGTIVWSPLARGRLARAWDEAKATARSGSDGFADMLYTQATADSDRAIIDAVGRVADARGVKRAQVALAWLRGQPVVTAPLVGASSTQQIDDAVRSLDIELTDDEIRALEAPYTPRYDFQGISDDNELQAIMARIPQFTTT